LSLILYSSNGTLVNPVNNITLNTRRIDFFNDGVVGLGDVKTGVKAYKFLIRKISEFVNSNRESTSFSIPFANEFKVVMEV